MLNFVMMNMLPACLDFEETGQDYTTEKNYDYEKSCFKHT